jgi:hypothetical protein
MHSRRLISRRARNARPAKCVAGSKTASRKIFSAPSNPRLENAPQVTNTHQESVTYVFDFASGCVVAPKKTPCDEARSAYNAAVTKFNQLRGASNTALGVRDAYKAAISKDSFWQESVNNAPDLLDVASSIADGPWTSVEGGLIKAVTFDWFRPGANLYDPTAAQAMSTYYAYAQAGRYFWARGEGAAALNAAKQSIGRGNAAVIMGALVIENVKIYGPGYLNMVNQNGTMIDLNDAVLEKQNAAFGSLEDVKRAAAAKDAACK